METQQISAFFSNLKTTLDITRRFQDANSLEYAFEFNPLIHFYDIGENRLSNLLTFFLKPHQRHGQGDIFLQSFLELFTKDGFNLKSIIGEYQKVTITRESQMDNLRRLDILLDFDNGRFGIGIENKIWAKDQYHQLIDYNNWLHRKYINNYLLIYLTPYGHPPSDSSITTEDFKKLSKDKKILLLNHSSDILDLITSWYSICKADKVRNFLKDFQQFIQHKINGNIFMNQQKTISEFVLGIDNSEYLKLAFGISESMESIKRAILGKFLSQMKEIACELNLTTTHDPEIWKNKGGINFLHPDLTIDGLRLKFVFGDTQIWNLGYGVICKELNKSVDSAYVKIIKDIQNDYNNRLNFQPPTNADWYAYDNRAEIRLGGAEGYIIVNSGEMKRIIKEKVVKLLSTFNELSPERYHFELETRSQSSENSSSPIV